MQTISNDMQTVTVIIGDKTYHCDSHGRIIPDDVIEAVVRLLGPLMEAPSPSTSTTAPPATE